MARVRPVSGYVDSEVGRLRTVLLHRPGAELKRLTPRNNDQLLFDGIPWVDRAQEEHDGFAQALRDHGVEVLYLADLLERALEEPAARELTAQAVLEDPRLGRTLRSVVGPYLADLHPADLAGVLTAGLTQQELKTGRGLTYRLMDEHDFVVDPLPNLLFTRDSSVWIRGEVAVTSPSMHARRREATVLRAVYLAPPALRRHRDALRAGARSGWRAATCCCSGRACSPSAPGSGPHRPAWRRSPAGCSPRASRTPCWSCRSRRSGRPCTWTPSARWSTSTR